jgi:hypothetical protein
LTNPQKGIWSITMPNMINPKKGIDLMNNNSIINRKLFAVTIFQQNTSKLLLDPETYKKPPVDPRNGIAGIEYQCLFIGRRFMSCK